MLAESQKPNYLCTIPVMRRVQPLCTDIYRVSQSAAPGRAGNSDFPAETSAYVSNPRLAVSNSPSPPLCRYGPDSALWLPHPERRLHILRPPVRATSLLFGADAVDSGRVRGLRAADSPPPKGRACNWARTLTGECRRVEPNSARRRRRRRHCQAQQQSRTEKKTTG